MENEKNLETVENVETTAVEETTENGDKIIIKFAKPYMFEGAEYKEIDLSGMKKMTILDIVDIQKQLFSEKEVAASVLAETSTAFARKVAAKATKMPIEFFQLMPRNLSRAVQRTVMAFLNIDVDIKNHVMKFEEPYIFAGKTYESIDLSKIGDLTSLNESEAENRLTREGIVATEVAQNCLYNCVIASMATGQPEEFFTGLPFRELLKFRVAVNDPSFFE